MLENLLTVEFSEAARRWTTVLFFWSGYAAWIGLLARTFFRARDFRSPWNAFCLGLVGVTLGSLVMSSFVRDARFDPVSPSGIVGSLLFSILAMVAYYVFSFLFPKREDAEEDEDLYEDEEEYREYNGLTREQLLIELLKTRRDLVNPRDSRRI